MGIWLASESGHGAQHSYLEGLNFMRGDLIISGRKRAKMRCVWGK